MPLNYTALSEQLSRRIREDRAAGVVNPYRFCDENAVRRIKTTHDASTLWRPTFVRDCEKILHLPLYSRYSDKTQVLSLYKNDDITRRGLHVQFVSRIARNIGSVLGLNLDLIEAISLGHDIGHTPFGHVGEQYLSELMQAECGRFFHHNVHSARVLDRIFARNVTLQTLDGILCHNGEFERQHYQPRQTDSFAEFDRAMEACYTEGAPAVARLVPGTLEGCVVRIADMIAYLGKDRQDARTARIIDETAPFTQGELGVENASIINNLVVDILEHSYGQPYIALSDESFCALSVAKKENYELIYKNEAICGNYDAVIRPMFADLFQRLLSDLRKGDETSYIFTHHIRYVEQNTRFYEGVRPYREQPPADIVADYIAGMTDDYFIDLHACLFPDSPYQVSYKPYF